MGRFLFFHILLAILASSIELFRKVINREIWMTENPNKTVNFSIRLLVATRVLLVKQEIDTCIAHRHRVIRVICSLRYDLAVDRMVEIGN